MKNTVVIGGNMSLINREDGQGEKVMIAKAVANPNVIVDHLEHGWHTPYTSSLSFNDVYNALENGILVFFLETYAGDIHYYVPFEVSPEQGEQYVGLIDNRNNKIECTGIIDLDAPLVFTDF